MGMITFSYIRGVQKVYKYTEFILPMTDYISDQEACYEKIIKCWFIRFQLEMNSTENYPAKELSTMSSNFVCTQNQMTYYDFPCWQLAAVRANENPRLNLTNQRRAVMGITAHSPKWRRLMLSVVREPIDLAHRGVLQSTWGLWVDNLQISYGATRRCSVIRVRNSWPDQWRLKERLVHTRIYIHRWRVHTKFEAVVVKIARRNLVTARLKDGRMGRCRTACSRKHPTPAPLIPEQYPH